MELEELTNIIKSKLNYMDFTKGEVLKILQDLDIKLNEEDIEKIISNLEKMGFSYENYDFDYTYDNIANDIFKDEQYNRNEARASYKFAEKQRVGNISTRFSSEQSIKYYSEEVLKKLSQNGIKCGDKLVSECVKQAFESNPKLNTLSQSSHLNDQKTLMANLCDKVLAHQNYLISLVNVKAADARLADLSESLQIKESKKEMQDKFTQAYPDVNTIDNQVAVQDANNTLATASINMAMDELGPTATPEQIKQRSLEILNEQKNIDSGKGSM